MYGSLRIRYIRRGSDDRKGKVGWEDIKDEYGGSMI
jgi:hypothetical protein